MDPEILTAMESHDNKPFAHQTMRAVYLARMERQHKELREEVKQLRSDVRELRSQLHSLGQGGQQ